MVNRRTMLVGTGVVAAGGVAAYMFAPRPDHAALAASIRNLGGPGDDLATLVRYATLAANSHNTQPWLFSRDGDRISIAPDFTRATPAADASHHHIFASLGCAAENLALAAAAAGRPPAIGFAADGERVEIDLATGAAARDPLFEAITARQCTRSDYDGRPVSPEDLSRIEQAATMPGAHVLIVTDEKKVSDVLGMVVAANTKQVDDPAFRRELKEWLRFGARLSVEKRDGLFSACSGNPVMPDWLGHAIFDFVFTAQGENDRYAKQIRSSSGLAIFFSDADDKSHWVQAGRAYQRFALAATTLGIRHAFVNQPIEVAAAREELAAWLGGGVSPDLVVRFGYAPPMPYSLRRPVEAVIA